MALWLLGTGIDCGSPWQGGSENGWFNYHGLDRAACNHNDCNYGNIRWLTATSLTGPGGV